MTDHKKLLDLYYDDELTAEQEAELHAWMKSDKANVETFVYEGMLHSRLSMRSQAEGYTEEQSPRSWWNSRVLALAATLLIVAGIGMAYYVYGSNVAVVAEVNGDVIVKSWGAPRQAFVGEKIYSGSRVICRDGSSQAVIKCNDGSSLSLGPRTELSFTVSRGQYRAFLYSGTLFAAIKKQKDKNPFIITTRTAVATVLGTELNLAAGDASTSMEVDKGLVRLTRIDDGKKVEVPAGQSVIASKDVEFEPEAWQWSDRFRGGSGAGAIVAGSAGIPMDNTLRFSGGAGSGSAGGGVQKTPGLTQGRTE